MSRSCNWLSIATLSFLYFIHRWGSSPEKRREKEETYNYDADKVTRDHSVPKSPISIIWTRRVCFFIDQIGSNKRIFKSRSQVCGDLLVSNCQHGQTIPTWSSILGHTALRLGWIGYDQAPCLAAFSPFALLELEYHDSSLRLKGKLTASPSLLLFIVIVIHGPSYDTPTLTHSICNIEGLRYTKVNEQASASNQKLALPKLAMKSWYR
jgi:hypothetical protein